VAAGAAAPPAVAGDSVLPEHAAINEAQASTINLGKFLDAMQAS
jgi:hypothetical protein